MTTMTATAVITAVDRASAVFARVGAAARAAGGRFGAAAGGVSKFSQAAMGGLGLPAAMAGAFAMRGEFDVDRISRQMEAVGELTELQRKALVASAQDAAIEVGEGTADILRGQKELIQGGLDPETVGQSIKDIVKVAKTNALPIADVAELGINAARALGLAFDTTEQKVASIKTALNFMSVVPAASTESVEGLRESMKYAAPVAGMLGIKISELGAALSILADRGFKGEEGGTAFRTILARGIAPTKQLAQAYRAAGIQMDELYRLDETKIRDMEALRERILGAGIGGEADVIDKAIKKTGDLSKFDGLYEYQDALMNSLSDALGIGAGDAQNKGILKKVLDQHMFASLDGFDIRKFFTAIRKLPLTDFAKVAGIQRMSQARSLLEDLDRLQPLMAKFEELMPGAIDRQAAPVLKGHATGIEKVAAAFEKLRHSIYESGLGDAITSAAKSLSDAVEHLSKTNPAVLNAIGIGFAALAAAPAVGAVIWGASTALGALGAVLSSPVWMTVLAAGGLAGVFGSMSGSDAAEIASSLGQVGTALGSIGGEAIGALGDLSTSIAEVVRELAALVGFNIEGSVLASGFRSLAAILEGIAATVKMIREGAWALGDLSEDIHRDYDENVRKSDEWWKSWWNGEGDGAMKPQSYDPAAAARDANAAEARRILGAGGTITPAQARALDPGGAAGAIPATVEPRQFQPLQESRPVDVRSHVTGEATVTNRFEIVVTAPPGFGATLNGNRSSTTTVPLNTGESMPDTAPPGK